MVLGKLLLTATALLILAGFTEALAQSAASPTSRRPKAPISRRSQAAAPIVKTAGQKLPDHARRTAGYNAVAA